MKYTIKFSNFIDNDIFREIIIALIKSRNLNISRKQLHTRNLRIMCFKAVHNMFIVLKFVIFFPTAILELPCKQSQNFLTLLPLRCSFSVGQFRSKILALPGFGYFSVEHARSFHYKAKIF